MSTSTFWLGGAMTTIVLLTAGVPSARQERLNARDPVLDNLLAEVRAIRAEISTATAVSIRAQLLVGRLQLQEHRILVLTGQLVDVTGQLTAAQSVVSRAAADVDNMEEERGRTTDARRLKQLDYELRTARQRLARAQKTEAQLQTQHTDLVTATSAEQGRWVEFSTKLDELERVLPRAPER